MGRSRGGVALRRWGLALLGAAAFACASSDPARVGADHLRRLAGAAVGPDAALVSIEAESVQGAWGRVVRARTEEPLEESRLLAALFDASDGGALEVVAGGPHAPLNEQVLLDAFGLAERAALGGLHLVIVGPETLSPRLARACEERRARCEHLPWRVRRD